jgi:hypothetical protein
MVGHLPAGYGNSLLDLLTDQAERADERWTSLFNLDAGAPPNDAPRRGRPRQPGSGVVPLDEDEDDEHPAAAPTGRAAVQRLLLAKLDQQIRLDLLNRHQSSGNDPALRRLADLAHPDCSHEWLWALSRHKGPVLDSQHYVEALRLRLGCAGPSEPVPCALWVRAA